jgi:hypothetical protein
MLIFLDIDGVMVPAKGWKAPELMKDGFPVFSSKAVQALRSLMAEDSTIMLTTSHKANYTKEEWNSIFSNRGIDVHRIGSLDENIQNLSRRDEIVNWFNVNHVKEDFIIIDDDKSLNGLPDFLKSRLVLTSALVGLTEEHVAMINTKKSKPVSA